MPDVSAPVASNTLAKANELSRVFMILLPEKAGPPRSSRSRTDAWREPMQRPRQHQL
jgi:hypothetical protein